jgi:uncharacterized protein involved in response to NO
MNPMQIPDARLLAAAPHRLMFFIGAGNVLLAMVWWTFWMINTRWHVTAMPQPDIPAGWMHALIMQYQVLPSFIFGFLLTVFPRWMGLSPLTRWHYMPVGFGLLGGQALTLASLFGVEHLLYLGWLLTLAGWTTGTAYLAMLVWRDSNSTWHAISALVALFLGLIGIGLIVAYLFNRDPHWMFAAIKFGGFGLLLPMYFTVCHRMLPFFANAALPAYAVYRPMWALALFWLLAMLHLGMELAHAYAWLWLADLPLAALSAWLLWRWWPHQRMPALLAVLMFGFAWLPIAAMLYGLQSLWLQNIGEFILGRAPAHALFIGFFGSLLVAMVTRVTQGHSGRPLQLGGVAAFAFIVIQITALVRITGEFSQDILVWHSAAGVLWLLAFLPWVLRSIWIYLTPRTDGQKG